MSVTVCLLANTLSYPQGGGHLWVYLNWAIGLRSNGCRVFWMESADPDGSEQKIKENTASLKSFLKEFDFADDVGLCSLTGKALPARVTEDCLSLEEIQQADLLLDMRHDTHESVVRSFRRTAFVDIDPGILQFWMALGKISIAPHDVYFTIGETVGTEEALFPDAGIRWQYTPPCVDLDLWPKILAEMDASFTTVSHWYDDMHMGIGGDSYPNSKREGFIPFLDLPNQVALPLELALCLDGDVKEHADLSERGWRVREAWEVASTPLDYQDYIQSSLGEFSCVKPSCVRLQNAWISDRTLCYLASGKPAVVQHTGASQFLPDTEGLFRFKDIKEAAQYLETVVSDYDRQCRLARALAEEYFDAKKVVKRVLELALA